MHIAGIAAVSIAVAAHLAGGGALLHLDPGGVLRNLSGGALAIAVVAIVVIKVLLIHATRRALSRR